MEVPAVYPKNFVVVIMTKLIDLSDADEVKSIVMPPSVYLKQAFAEQPNPQISELSKTVQLSEDETKIIRLPY